MLLTFMSGCDFTTISGRFHKQQLEKNRVRSRDHDDVETMSTVKVSIFRRL